jgi:proteasome accessory factor B
MSGVSQEGRLLALTCVLLTTSIGLTRQEVFTAVPGYDGDKVAALRKFERDKTRLRAIGIELEVLPAFDDPNNLNDARYRVSKEIFVWPEGFAVSARQLQYLELAAKAWATPEMRAAAGLAVTRLRSMGFAVERDPGSLINPRLVANDPMFIEVTSAIESGQSIEFQYRKLDGTQSVRVVSPWLIRSISGQFVLLGVDHSDSVVKNFLLRRIVSRPKISTQDYRQGTRSEIRETEASLTKHILGQVARLRVQKGTEAWVHFGIADSDGDQQQNETDSTIEVNFMDIELLAEELIEYGNSVEVIEPAELKQLIVSRFRQVMAQHA